MIGKHEWILLPCLAGFHHLQNVADQRLKSTPKRCLDEWENPAPAEVLKTRTTSAGLCSPEIANFPVLPRRFGCLWAHLLEGAIQTNYQLPDDFRNVIAPFCLSQGESCQTGIFESLCSQRSQMVPKDLLEAEKPFARESAFQAADHYFAGPR